MKKAELEFELRNGYDYNVQKISYHLAKKQDAQNNYIKGTHEKMLIFHELNKMQIIQLINSLTDDNVDEISQEFENMKAPK
jgi:hypothetical protein